ncbi:uncharacterized protein PG998_008624 [Apiospora kogelbergensis]|uniref:uncharacterized protein n=1 Tax=Apiospora kogelbergensis TaxID=1337665 RepID=UPI00312CFE8A
MDQSPHDNSHPTSANERIARFLPSQPARGEDRLPDRPRARDHLRLPLTVVVVLIALDQFTTATATAKITDELDRQSSVGWYGSCSSASSKPSSLPRLSPPRHRHLRAWQRDMRYRAGEGEDDRSMYPDVTE